MVDEVLDGIRWEFKNQGIDVADQVMGYMPEKPPEQEIIAGATFVWAQSVGAQPRAAADCKVLSSFHKGKENGNGRKLSWLGAIVSWAIGNVAHGNWRAVQRHA